MKSIVLLTSIFLTFFAWGSIEKKIQLEREIESRVLELTQKLDPSAQVFAKIEFNTSNTPLAGTSIDLLNISSSTEGSIDYNDIKKIDIKILTSSNKNMDWFKTQIQDQFSYKGTTVNVDINEMDANIKAQVQEQSLHKVISAQNDKFRDSMLIAVAGFSGLILVLFVLLNWQGKKQVRENVDKVVAALKESSTGSMNMPISPMVEAHRPDTPQLKPANAGFLSQGDSSSSSFKKFSCEQIVALFSDCYWSQHDNYASWMWQNMSSEQRKKLLDEWEIADHYSKYLTYIEPLAENYHNHTTYLTPLQIQEVSQDDLAKWLRQNPGAWSLLSPIRQESCPVSIQEQINFMQTPANARNEYKLPRVKSKKRPLTLKANFSDITIEDEKAIWENPSFVPENFRREIPTLVWLAKEPEQVRREILEPLNAQQIAQAWIGPKVVLDSLQVSISNKKWTLIESYLKTINPSRQSPSFQYLTQVAFTEKEVEVHDPEVEDIDSDEVINGESA